MVREQDDDRLLCAIARVQRVEQPPNHCVGKADARQIRLHSLPPVTALEDPPVQTLVRGVPFRARYIVEVAGHGCRQLDPIEWVHVEIGLGHVPRNVGPVDPYAEKQGGFQLRLELPACPGNHLSVSHRRVLGGYRRPVEKSANESGIPVDRAPERPDLVRELPSWRRIVVIEALLREQAVELNWIDRRCVEKLAASECAVAIALKEQRKDGLAFQRGSLSPVLSIEIHAQRRRQHPAHERGARGIAQRRCHMRIRERDPSTRQTVDAGGLGLRMSAERTDPVVQIIDGDE